MRYLLVATDKSSANKVIDIPREIINTKKIQHTNHKTLPNKKRKLHTKPTKNNKKIKQTSRSLAR